MSIKGNIGQAVIDLAAVSVDTTLFDDANRAGITAMTIHNALDVGDREVYIFISPNLTSASGKRHAVYNIPPKVTVDITELLGQGIASNEQIISVVQTAGAVLADLNCKLTFIQYTGES